MYNALADGMRRYAAASSAESHSVDAPGCTNWFFMPHVSHAGVKDYFTPSQASRTQGILGRYAEA